MAKIPLSQGAYALVDDDDYLILSKYRWHLWKEYAARWSYGQHVRMHKLILFAPSGKVVDHINGDHLDNRKQNLQVITQSANIAKASNRNPLGRGVSFHKITGKYRAYVVRNYKQTYLGLFDTAEQARLARLAWEQSNA